ncbi:AraC family transcriptional regulator [Pedobacter africanus]|uniref:Transcriptional regulator, AraC family n=1 Tax=Pedobacter africanus TaxID=151894 RepID=A0A1W2DIB6_9SPHI|nr:helix-turn-helix transcriptional regulator [Pedobacter africanus]SMC97247.1 transcriptional regulator, AraC family [Pedobacter africanus]
MSIQSKSAIPAFSLSEAVKLANPDPVPGADYSVNSFSSAVELNGVPHRASYFGIALCLEGSAKLVADLEDYRLLPGSLIVMPPETIRTWKLVSADYKEETLFFTAAFFLETETALLAFKQFRFFQTEVPKVIRLGGEVRILIRNLLQDIKKATGGHTLRKDAIVRSYIHILLNQVADLYDEYCPDDKTELTAAAKIVSDFKKLLIEKQLQLRSVNGYADILNVSAKHLSQTLKDQTGKTAGDWIHEALILEAKVRLKQTALTVAQIAEALNFSDPSLFGKYFRRYAGCSPAFYRKNTVVMV